MTADSDLVLVRIVLPREDGRGVRSSVSLDGYLFGLLSRALGGNAVATRWIKAEAVVQAQAVAGGPKAGLSRLVQRAVMRHLFEGMFRPGVTCNTG